MAAHGPGEAPTYDASNLRIAILHSRWNTPIISSLVNGAQSSLTHAGVPTSNILIQSVPGSYELPLAASRMIVAASQSSSTSVSSAGNLVGSAADLLGSATDLVSTESKTTAASEKKEGRDGKKRANGPFDAVIAIGVLIKGSTMHFEYIADAVSHGLMRVQVDTGVPVIFGLLTCLDEEQAKTRAGLAAGKGEGEGGSYAERGHNHGEDWGDAAVEMAVKRKAWGEGVFVE
ncbi:MAG: hypothetical protein M1831_003888 [Alyxoria varia]|nr:MAG: hypothetical protein M1831_003888 [Alyxoria varia]